MTFPDDPPNPWISHKSVSLFENDWLTLERNDVTRPDGSEGDYTLVRFRNRAVGVVPYEAGGVWMVGQTRFALNQYSWEIPEGGVPAGEDMLEAAKRELKEETGLTARQYVHLLDLHTSNSVTDEWGQIYLATDLTKGASEPEPSEDITCLFVTLDEALQAIDDGRVTDAMTVAALYKVAMMRERGELD